MISIRPPSAQGLDGVVHQVNEDLPEASRIDGDDARRISLVQAQLDASLVQIGAQKCQRAADFVADIDRDGRLAARADKTQHFTHQRFQAHDLFFHLVEHRGDFFVAERRFVAKDLPDGVHVQADGVERIANFMGDADDQLVHFRDAAGVGRFDLVLQAGRMPSDVHDARGSKASAGSTPP